MNREIIEQAINLLTLHSEGEIAGYVFDQFGGVDAGG